jgi:DNA polymerase III subunit delta
LLYILSGPDDYSIAQELEAIKKTCGEPSILAISTTSIDGTQSTANEFQSACQTAPFLSDKRLVITYGLLERFAVKTSVNHPAGTWKTEGAILYENFGNIINELPESTILVLIEGELKETNPLLKMIAKNGTKRVFPLMKTPELRQWVNQQVSKSGSSISVSAVSILFRLIGSSLWTMSNEVEKLVAYADGRCIEETDVKAMVSYSQQTNVFAMVDAIVELNIQKAETLLQQLLNEGATPTHLLAMLNRQMRLIVRARELKNHKLPDDEIGHRLSISSDFVIRKTMEQAQRYSLLRIKQVYQKLVETDLAIKTGKYDGELALNILIADLCQPQNSLQTMVK